MKIRIGFNGSFTGLLYSAGKLRKLNMRSGNRERAGEHPHQRTCYHVLSVRAHTLFAIIISADATLETAAMLTS